LENIIEQSVIFSTGQQPLELGRSLANSLFQAEAPPAGPVVATTSKETKPVQVAKSLRDVKQMHQENEREYILSILVKTNGRVRGSGGAAELLNLKPTTLEYRMEKLGIRKSVTTAGPEA
jgi:transcriptional regulator with GAF, ATPase, and Fis domain